MATARICDFCGKTEHQVPLLLAGPKSLAICDACIDAGAERLRELRGIHSMHDHLCPTCTARAREAEARDVLRGFVGAGPQRRQPS